MTDKKTEIPQASPAATSASSTPSGQAGGAAASKAAGSAGSTSTPKSPGPATSPATPPAPAARRKSRSPLLPAFLVALLVVAALAAVVWYQQKQFEQTQASLAGQVQDSTLAVRQAADQAQQALTLSQEQSRQIAALENSLREFRGQIDGLDQAFQTLTDSSSDLVLINDVDHLVTIAQQQLQLGGNVANAVISLETAQAQLARANRPGLASLQQTLNGDLDRLRAASTIDIALLSTQLDELSGLISQAALLVPDDAAPEPVAAPESESAAAAASSAPDGAADPDALWWKQGLATAESWSRTAWDSIQRDLGQFITVRRVDDATALLMSPDQATRFRETLRLRIMTAQLALMMRQPKVWEAETDSLVKSIETRFDERSPQTRQALKIARHMADTSIDVKLPTVANTLQSIETLREEQARHAGQGQDGAPAAENEPAEAPRADEPAPAPEADPSADDAAPAAAAAAGSTTTVGS